MIPHRLIIKNSPGKGRGVFASVAFKAGDLIEECPVIVLDKDEVAHIEATILDHYYFWWNMAVDGTGAIVLGNGMLYNHCDRPNARYLRQFDTLTMCFHAIRDIEPGEEVSVNYRGNHSNNDPLWFDPIE